MAIPGASSEGEDGRHRWSYIRPNHDSVFDAERRGGTRRRYRTFQVTIVDIFGDYGGLGSSWVGCDKALGDLGCWFLRSRSADGLGG